MADLNTQYLLKVNTEATNTKQKEIESEMNIKQEKDESTLPELSEVEIIRKEFDKLASDKMKDAKSGPIEKYAYQFTK